MHPDLSARGPDPLPALPLLHPQAGPGGDRCQREHACGNPQRASALWRPWPQEVAVRRLV